MVANPSPSTTPQPNTPAAVVTRTGVQTRSQSRLSITTQHSAAEEQNKEIESHEDLLVDMVFATVRKWKNYISQSSAKEEQNKKQTATLVTQLENALDEGNIAKSQLQNSERRLDAARKRQQDSDNLIEDLKNSLLALKKDHEILKENIEILQVENDTLHNEKIIFEARLKLQSKLKGS